MEIVEICGNRKRRPHKLPVSRCPRRLLTGDLNFSAATAEAILSDPASFRRVLGFRNVGAF